MNMSFIAVERLVDDLFSGNLPPYGQICRNPVTGGTFLSGADPIALQKARACRALRAREWFYHHGPRDAPQLPLSDIELADLKFTDPLSHIVSCFGYSLRSHDWNFNSHPSFEDFARGVLASDHAPDFLRADKAICERYPPRRLRYMGRGLCWEKPKH